MANYYIQQDLSLTPCPDKKIVKKHFEKVLKSVGAEKNTEEGQQCWCYGNFTIFYQIRLLESGVKLSYSVYPNGRFVEDEVMAIVQRINNTARELLPPSESNEVNEEKPRLKTKEISAYVIKEDSTPQNDTHFLNFRWPSIIVGIIGVLMALYIFGVFDFNSSSSSSYSTSSNTSSNTSSFTSAKDVVRYIDGESIYTPLGYLYVRNGSVYDGAGDFVNNVIVDSYTSTSAIIEIYPSPYGGSPMRFRVDKNSGNISRIN